MSRQTVSFICGLFLAAALLPSCAAGSSAQARKAGPEGDKLGNAIRLPHANARVDRLIAYFADAYALPEQFVRRVVLRESGGRAQARNGRYWGLMQISYATAKNMGYRGPPEGLLDAQTNLRYAVKYLAGAYMTAGGNEALATRFYARGFYHEARRKGLLEATGLRPGPHSPKTVMSSPK